MYRDFGSVSFRQDCAVEWTDTVQTGFCRSCGSEWKSRGIISACPFCGKPPVYANKKPAAGSTDAPRDVIRSGSCGYSVRYALDSDGTLIISGKGKMTDFDWYSSSPFYNNSSIKTIVIEAGVTSIGDFAFRSCTGLASLTVPDSITSIGDEAFRSCTGLTDLSIPHSVTTIGSGAFRDCIGLTNVVLPDSVTRIFGGAFRNCTGLKTIWIPETTTQIGNGTFEECTDDLTIHGVKNSYAGEYAKNNGITFSADPIVADTGSDAIEINNTSVVSGSSTINGQKLRIQILTGKALRQPQIPVLAAKVSGISLTATARLR